MISLLNIIRFALLFFCILLVQATPAVQPTNDTNENKSALTNDQLYEIYKVIREDPRYAEVSNRDIITFIYRNLVLGKDMNLIKGMLQKRPRHRQANRYQTE